MVDLGKPKRLKRKGIHIRNDKNGRFKGFVVCAMYAKVATEFEFECRRDLTTNCGPDDAAPATRANTTANLAALRSVMAERGVDAYIVPLDHEGRREWISGFTGSNGDCIVTMDLVYHS